MNALTQLQKNKEEKLFFLLFIISIPLSHVGIIGIENPAIMPNYFIALIVSFILTKKAALSLNKVLFIGLVVDILIGKLIGQYGLIFIIIYILDLLINKVIFIKYEKQIESLSLFLIFSSFIVLWVTSQNFNIFIPLKVLILQAILTFIAYLFFKVAITKYISK